MDDGGVTERPEKDPKKPDRRKQLRGHLLVLKVKGERHNREVFFGYAKNLSRTGMFIASVNPRQVGDEFTIAFRLPGAQGVEVRCRCRVVWRREFDPRFKDEPGMGIEFLGLDPLLQKRIESWVMSQ